jgi:hypothetical protein
MAHRRTDRSQTWAPPPGLPLSRAECVFNKTESGVWVRLAPAPTKRPVVWQVDPTRPHGDEGRQQE